jgi:hypothetical protein
VHALAMLNAGRPLGAPHHRRRILALSGLTRLRGGTRSARAAMATKVTSASGSWPPSENPVGLKQFHLRGHGVQDRALPGALCNQRRDSPERRLLLGYALHFRARVGVANRRGPQVQRTGQRAFSVSSGNASVSYLAAPQHPDMRPRTTIGHRRRSGYRARDRAAMAPMAPE